MGAELSQRHSISMDEAMKPIGSFKPRVPTRFEDLAISDLGLSDFCSMCCRRQKCESGRALVTGRALAQDAWEYNYVKVLLYLQF